MSHFRQARDFLIANRSNYEVAAAGFLWPQLSPPGGTVDPRAIMNDDFVKFDKSMEAIDTVADPVMKSRGIMKAAE